MLVQLNRNGQVSCARGAQHGEWHLGPDDGLLHVKFHCKNQEAQAKDCTFRRVPGTTAWEKINGDSKWKFWLIESDEP
jgi:hypothetical protein